MNTTFSTTVDEARSGAERIGRQARAAGRSLWLASLGAAAALGAEGQELLGRLVERGRPVSERQLARWAQARLKAAELATGTRDLARETLEYEAHRAVKRLGVMTAEDLTAFSARLESLAQRIEELSAERSIGEADDDAAAPAAGASRGRGRRKAAAAEPSN